MLQNTLIGGFSQYDEVTLVRHGRKVVRCYTCLVMDGMDRSTFTTYANRKKAIQAVEQGLKDLLDQGYRPF